MFLYHPMYGNNCLHLVDCYGFHVGKYTIYMDPMGLVFRGVFRYLSILGSVDPLGWLSQSHLQASGIQKG